MTTDGGGWTMVASTRTTTLDDALIAYHNDLQTINPGAAHPGVVYEIAAHEMPVLDRFEGVGHGYTRTNAFPVTLPVLVISTVTVKPSTSLKVVAESAGLP